MGRLAGSAVICSGESPAAWERLPGEANITLHGRGRSCNRSRSDTRGSKRQLRPQSQSRLQPPRLFLFRVLHHAPTTVPPLLPPPTHRPKPGLLSAGTVACHGGEVCTAIAARQTAYTVRTRGTVADVAAVAVVVRAAVAPAVAATIRDGHCPPATAPAHVPAPGPAHCSGSCANLLRPASKLPEGPNPCNSHGRVRRWTVSYRHRRSANRSNRLYSGHGGGDRRSRRHSDSPARSHSHGRSRRWRVPTAPASTSVSAPSPAPCSSSRAIPPPLHRRPSGSTDHSNRDNRAQPCAAVCLVDAAAVERHSLFVAAAPIAAGARPNHSNEESAGCRPLAAGHRPPAAGCSTCVLLARWPYCASPRSLSARFSPARTKAQAEGSGAKQEPSGQAKAASGTWRHVPPARIQNLGTPLDLCVSSLRRGHANLLCIAAPERGGRSAKNCPHLESDQSLAGTLGKSGKSPSMRGIAREEQE